MCVSMGVGVRACARTDEDAMRRQPRGCSCSPRRTHLSVDGEPLRLVERFPAVARRRRHATAAAAATARAVAVDQASRSHRPCVRHERLANLCGRVSADENT